MEIHARVGRSHVSEYVVRNAQGDIVDLSVLPGVRIEAIAGGKKIDSSSEDVVILPSKLLIKWGALKIKPASYAAMIAIYQDGDDIGKDLFLGQDITLDLKPYAPA